MWSILDKIFVTYGKLALYESYYGYIRMIRVLKVKLLRLVIIPQSYIFFSKLYDFFSISSIIRV